MNSIKLNGTNDIELVRTSLRPEVGREAENQTIVHPEAGSPVSTQDTIKDVIKVSDQATTIRTLVEKTSQLSGIRPDRVEHLRLQVQAGNYNPAATDIADALLKSQR